MIIDELQLEESLFWVDKDILLWSI